MATSIQDQTTLQNRLFAILQSPEAQRIDFTLGSIKVDGKGLMEVVTSLMLGTLHIDITTMDAGAAAQYLPHGNTFQFPNAGFGVLATDESSILHECVHAMQDLDYGYDFSRGDYFTMESENEAVAYVAGCLYDFYKLPNPAYTGMAWVAAQKIAVKIKDTPGAVVSDADVQTLRGVIVSDPVYQTRTFATDDTYSDGASQ
jgi:hypothetical protein